MQQGSSFTAVRSEMYQRRYEHFRIGQTATLMAVRPALGGVTTRICQMIDISLGGATFSVNTTIGLPQHYYLNILGTNKRIGCAEIYRQDKRIGVHFIRPINEEVLHQIVRYEFFTGQAMKKQGASGSTRVKDAERPF